MALDAMITYDRDLELNGKYHIVTELASSYLVLGVTVLSALEDLEGAWFG